MSGNTNEESGTRTQPDYDVDVDADELLADLADRASTIAREHAEHRRNYREDSWAMYREWELQAKAKLSAYMRAMVMIQPSGGSDAGICRLDDGTVDVREYMARLHKRHVHHTDRSTSMNRSGRRAHEIASAYGDILSLLRDDYGVGWPRLDDVGGNPLEADMP